MEAKSTYGILLAVALFVIFAQQTEARTKYLCPSCISKGLYRKPFAYVTMPDNGPPTRIKLSRNFFRQSKCDEEGNFPHPLGDCRKYFRCHKKGTAPRLLQCRPGKTFDPIARECIDELHARDCKACNKPRGYKIPHERGHKMFYMCQDGVAYAFECINAKFDKHTHTCGNRKAPLDPADFDESYVPGSIMVHGHRGEKFKRWTGLQFNLKQKPFKDVPYIETSVI